MNLLLLAMFKTNQTIGTKTMNKTNKKRTVETINIKIPTSEILITFALVYSNLTNQGKKEAQQQLKLIGENYDKLVDLNNNL
jgi:hypothetical protein